MSDFENQLSIPQQRSTTTEMAVSNRSSQVQVAMLSAKRFPRDEVEAYNRIMKACQRKSLAEQATYSYPRGGSKVTGPSIRLAEALAQNWGNMEFGITELEQKNGSSTVEAFAWDLETNTKRSMIFEVNHIRSKKGGNEKLSDPRDIYEMVANQGSRRVRACILAVIPGDVVEAAVNQCNVTLASKNSEPLIDRVRKMCAAFEKWGVTKDLIENKIGYSTDKFGEDDFVELIGIYNSIKDGAAKKEDFFEFKPKVSEAAKNLSEEFKQESLINGGNK